MTRRFPLAWLENTSRQPSKKVHETTRVLLSDRPREDYGPHATRQGRAMMIMPDPGRATRYSRTTPMAPIFKVSERVVVDVRGFKPWPATIESIVSDEQENDVNYHVKLLGSSKIIPIKKENIKQLGVVDAERYNAMSPDELWHGARKRLEVIEGVYISMFSDSGIPSALWNYVPAESDYEEIPDVDKAKLKLSCVAHNAQVRFKELESKFALHAEQNKMLRRKKKETDKYRGTDEKVGRKSVSSSMLIRFPCPICMKKFKTRMALKKHMEFNVDCATSKKTAQSGEQPRQCPKCFSLYKDEESLLKHMAVHVKTLQKKKSGIRDYIRQIMSNNKACRVPSFSPIHTAKSKANSVINTAKRNANTINGKLQGVQRMLPNRKVRQVVSPDDSEREEDKGDEEDDDESDDNSTSETDSIKTTASKACRVCSRKQCKCKQNYILNRNNEIHSERERERRKSMREAFEHLGRILGVTTKSAKNELLRLARDEVHKLVERQKRLERTLADLRDMNVRLVNREYHLSHVNL